MVGLPWPFGRRDKQQATATIPPSSIPAFSPSTASPAVSAAHAAPGHLPIRVDPQTAQQVWQGWGTSLCWWANVVGEEKEKVIDSYFSTLRPPDPVLSRSPSSETDQQPPPPPPPPPPP